ncbi:MAG TPA: stalk domain-containing protein [Candidatus Dormibacteraeota bacterium]|nr:stalk domain-containing protein [Candidatus Dormibacteraeota bacterium]
MRLLSWPCAAIFAAMALWAPAISHAQGTPDFGVPPSGTIPILYNDHHVYANPDVLKQDRVLAALVRNGTILIPLRSMFEQMGATVSYDPSTQTVTASKAGASVSVTVGKPEVVINGETRPLDVPPIMWHGQVLVPVRVISEGMGAYVEWVPDRHIVVVRYIVPTPMPPPPTMAPPPPTMAPPPPTPAPNRWAGIYVGANIGGIVNHDTGGDTCTTPGGVVYGPGCSIDAGIGKMNAAGFLGGVQLGANLQAGHFVIGPEFDYQGTTLQGSSNFYGILPEYGSSGCCNVHFSASESMTSFQTERLRIGLASPNTLIYLTGGWAQANVTLSTNYAFSHLQYPGTISVERSGWTEGLGGEWAISPRMSMKLEGLLYTLQPYSTAFFRTGSTSGYSGGKDFYFHGNVVRLGVNWKL